MLEYFEEGILTTLIGMGVVFSVLIVLSLMIKWLNSGVNAAMGRKPKNEEINISQSEQAPAKPEMKKNQSISPAVVAAITATICALTGKTAEEFKFTEIRRVSHIRHTWSVAGTQDIMSTRQRFIERGNR
jgi:sodium pump decarboxylase gamma subunit